MSLEDIVNVSVDVNSGAGVTVRNFGTPLILAYHINWGTGNGERVRTYTSLKALVSDGFRASSPVYKMAAAIFAQKPRVKRIAVGRRANAFEQIIRFTPESPALGKEYSVTVNGLVASYTATGADTVASVCSNLALALNAINGDSLNAIKTNANSSASPQTFTGAQINGVIGTRTMDPPRALSLKVNSHADWDATNAVVTGTAMNGSVITDTFAIPNGGGSTILGTKLFRTVAQIDIPAQSGTNGVFSVGVQEFFTADASSATHVDVDATIDGTLQTYDDWSDTLTMKDITADPGIVDDFEACLAASNDWYGVVLDSNSQAEIEALAHSIETLEKMLCVQNADTANADSASTTDVLYVLKDTSYFRTVAFAQTSVASTWVAAAMLGNRFPDNPGSDTWAFKTFPGVSSDEWTDTEETNILAKNGNVYRTVEGATFTRNGKTSGGEWADVIRGIDWWVAGVRSKVLTLQLAMKKIPYTTAGMDLIAGKIRQQNSEGLTVGLISPDVEPVVNVPDIGDVPTEDKENRILKNVTFSWTLAGAIHAVEITGSVSV